MICTTIDIANLCMVWEFDKNMFANVEIMVSVKGKIGFVGLRQSQTIWIGTKHLLRKCYLSVWFSNDFLETLYWLRHVIINKHPTINKWAVRVMNSHLSNNSLASLSVISKSTNLLDRKLTVDLQKLAQICPSCQCHVMQYLPDTCKKEGAGLGPSEFSSKWASHSCALFAPPPPAPPWEELLFPIISKEKGRERVGAGGCIPTTRKWGWC